MRTEKILVWLLAAVVLTCFCSCMETEEKVDPVDLRFRTEDSYSISALSPEEFSFVVKSSDPWEVFSYHPEWCEITPSTGNPGEKYTVTVKYHDSDQLDDRVDTIVIKSGYWTGKWITVNQKGTAYLDVDRTEHNVDRTGALLEIKVSSNQKWSSDILSGEEWMSIEEGLEGEKDGILKIDVKANKGEIREGHVVIRDRNGDEAAMLIITEDGIQLQPDNTELRLFHYEEKASINVESDARWAVLKDDEAATWYSFGQNEFEGDSQLELTLSPNKTGGMRKATFTIFTTDTEAGTVPVRKQITLKQAGEPAFTRYTWSKDLKPWEVHSSWPIATYPIEVGDDGSVHFTKSGARMVLYAKNHLTPGYYRFRVKMDSDITVTNIYFQFYGSDTAPNEIRWHLNAATGKTDASTAPNSDVYSHNIPFDKTVANDLMLVMLEDNGYIHFEWWLNDTKFAEISSSPTFMKNATWEGKDHIQIQVGSDWHNNGAATFEYYEIAPPVDWNQE